MKKYIITNDFEGTQWVNGEDVNGLINGEKYVVVECKDDNGNVHEGYCKQIDDSGQYPIDECVDWENVIVVE